MAKRKTKTRKRRRVGATGLTSGIGLKLLAIGAGYLLGDALNKPVDRMLSKPAVPGDPPKDYNKALVYVPEIGLGGLLLLSRGGGRTGKLKTIAGGIMAGAGLKLALRSMGVIKGYQNVPVIGRRRMAGYQNVPVIGKSTPPQLQGIPAQLQGFRVNGGMNNNGYTSQGSGVMAGIQPNANGSGLNGSGYLG